MKTTIGGDRLGSGNKQNISMRNYERSTHDLSSIWRSSMASGTLVPFMSELALPGDSWDIDLACEVLTLPTIGPLFGSFKVQLDVFQIPIRLYNAKLHMNMLGIGMDMSQIALPTMSLRALNPNYPDTIPELGDYTDDNFQVNPSSLVKYMGISGLGFYEDDGDETEYIQRDFNGVPMLAYWDIYKNYYANKQEERGFCIHTSLDDVNAAQGVEQAILYRNGSPIGNVLNTPQSTGTTTEHEMFRIIVRFPQDAQKPDPNLIMMVVDSNPIPINQVLTMASWDEQNKRWTFQDEYNFAVAQQWIVPMQTVGPEDTEARNLTPKLYEFALDNIDEMRMRILQSPTGLIDISNQASLAPYTLIKEALYDETSETTFGYSVQYSQELLGIKTYQSDLFNNWISTEWIDGPNGVNAVTAVDTTGDSFTIDALNLAQKVYVMLNRIAISGGTYDDWLDAVYTHERAKSVESPVYMGSLIKELAFEEVVSTAASEAQGPEPLGQLAGRGRLTNKNKGGHIKIKVDEPSYIMGIVSLTPRVDYSQGNKWDVNLRTMNDLHKPALDAIGYQDLITDQMAWQETTIDSEQLPIFKSAGKQPAWINYMTAVNQTFGNFAVKTKEMFMTLNRRYDTGENGIEDLTTYIDPTKFNHIFAETNIDAQNFWVQIAKNITTRRKMSAKVIPNL